MDVKHLEKDDVTQITDNETKIVIKVEGYGLEGQIDAAIASQILFIQHEIFRIAKIVIFGDEASSRRLPRDIQNDLLVQFKVDRGCTELLGEIVEPLTSIFTVWGNKMTPEQVTEVVKTISYLFAGGVFSFKFLNTVKELIAKYLDNKHAQQTSEQSNQHAEAIADKIIKSATSAADNIVEAAAKNFRSANYMKYGPRELNQQQLEEIRGRAPRVRTKDDKEIHSYIVLRLNGERRPTFYAELQEFPDGKIYKAIYSQSESSLFAEDDESEDYVVREMSLAFARNEPIKLSVVYSRNEAGEVVKVVILGTE